MSELRHTTTDEPSSNPTSPLPLGASTFCLLFEPWQKAVDTLLAQGFRAIELFGEAPQGHVTQLTPSDRRALRALSRTCDLSYHAPTFELNVASSNPSSRAEAVRQYREAVYLVAEVDASRLVLHEGNMSYWKLDRRAAREAALESLTEVVGLARQIGVTVVLENTNYGKFAMYDTWQEWLVMADKLGGGDDASVALVLDVGHARLAGWDLEELTRSIGGRLAQIHVHDNMGSADDHLMPGLGVVDWAGLRRGLAESGSKAALILESGPFRSAEDAAAGKQWLEDWARR